MGSHASKMKDIPELTKVLSKSKVFEKASLGVHDLQNKNLKNFHKELHNSAFPDNKIDEPKKLEDFNKYRDP